MLRSPGMGCGSLVPLQGEAEQSGSFKSQHEVGDPQDSPLPRQDHTSTVLKIMECLKQGDSPN